MNKLVLSACLLLTAVLAASCGGHSEQIKEAQINASVVAALGDLMRGDYNDVISRINSSGTFSRDDIFGNSHDFTSKERALSYIASVNGATFFVMDSLQLRIEEAAVAVPDNQMLAKLNKLAKKYIEAVKYPTAAPDQLLAQCKSISEAITTTVGNMGKLDPAEVKERTALAGAAVMHREMQAAQKAADANSAEAQKRRTEGEAFLKANAKKAGVEVMADGLQYKVIRNGQGISPNGASMVRVEYEGRFVDGSVFDSSAKQGKPKGVEFAVSSVMPGWQEALLHMKKGSEWEIYVPSELAYGEEGEGDVPPFAVLIFQLKLLDIR